MSKVSPQIYVCKYPDMNCVPYSSAGSCETLQQCLEEKNHGSPLPKPPFPIIFPRTRLAGSIFHSALDSSFIMLIETLDRLDGVFLLPAVRGATRGRFEASNSSPACTV